MKNFMAILVAMLFLSPGLIGAFGLTKIKKKGGERG